MIHPAALSVGLTQPLAWGEGPCGHTGTDNYQYCESSVEVLRMHPDTPKHREDAPSHSFDMVFATPPGGVLIPVAQVGAKPDEGTHRAVD